MLIDFSDVLSVSRLSLARLSIEVILTPDQVNVFKLGATYKALLKECTIEGVEPMLPEHLVYRFATKLEFGSMTERVAQDAVRLVQRMDRDWMTTGRRPSGVCGACLILAARMNNFRRTVREVVYIAKVTEITITKRLDEFKATASSGLTVDQFRIINLEKTHDPPAFYQKKAGTRKRKRTRQGEDEEENESDGSEDDGAQSDAQANDQRPGSERAASNAPPQRPPRRDKDGFAIPDIPIDPKLLAVSASALSELTNPLAVAKAIASETEVEARPRKRAKTKYPEPSAEEIADEQALETEISRLVNAPSTQEHVNAYVASTATERSAAEARSRAGTPAPAESVAREAMLRASMQATPQRDKTAATVEAQKAAGSASSQSTANDSVAPLSGARRRALLRSIPGTTPADTEAVPLQKSTEASGGDEVAAITAAASGSTPFTAASADGAAKTIASPATASSADGRQGSDEPSASAPAGPKISSTETATMAMETAQKNSTSSAREGSSSEPQSPDPHATPATSAGQKSVPTADPASCADQEAPSSVRTTEDISDGEFADDPEVESCMLSPEEQEMKERIWVHENRDYLREQQRKMLRRQLEEKNGTKKTRVTKRKNRARVGEGGNGERAMSAAEATIDMLERRAPSRKINYDIIKEMFGERKSADASREVSVAASEGAASVTSASGARPANRRTRAAAAASLANVRVNGAAAIAKGARAKTTEKGNATTTTSNDTNKDSNINDAGNEEANDDEGSNEDDDGKAKEDGEEEVDVDDDEVMYDEPEEEIAEDMDDYDDDDGGYY